MNTIRHIFTLDMRIIIIVEINSGVVEGKFPKRALKHVMEWYEQHKEELLKNWETIQESGEFKKIEPLE